ncbi:GAF and ANTAR domain-containing protein [Spirillospora sp. CA-253888]
MVVSSEQERIWALIAHSAHTRGEPMSIRDTCRVCAQILKVGGVGISIRIGHRLEPVHAEGRLGRELLEAEMTSGDGPCVEAMRTGAPVLAADLGDAECGRRWPLFTATAHAGKVAAAFAFPLATGIARVGVLVACRDHPGPLSADQHRDALICADVATTLLLTQTPDSRAGIGDQTGGQAVSADWLALGAEVHQAAGMVSVQLDCTVEHALDRLRAHAFAHTQPLSHIARQVVARKLRFTPDTTRP